MAKMYKILTIILSRDSPMWIPIFRKNAHVVKTPNFVRIASDDFQLIGIQLLNYLQSNPACALAVVFPDNNQIKIHELPDSDITFIWLDDAGTLARAYKEKYSEQNFKLVLQQVDLSKVSIAAALSQNYKRLAMEACGELLFQFRNSSSESKEQAPYSIVLGNLVQLGFDREKIIRQIYKADCERMGNVKFIDQSEQLLTRLKNLGLEHVFSNDDIECLLSDLVYAYQKGELGQGEERLSSSLQKLSKLVPESYHVLFCAGDKPSLNLELRTLHTVLGVIRSNALNKLLQPMYVLFLNCIMIENAREEAKLFENAAVDLSHINANSPWHDKFNYSSYVHKERIVSKKKVKDDKTIQITTEQFALSDELKREVLSCVIDAIQPEVDPKPTSIQALWILFNVMPLMSINDQELGKKAVDRICQNLFNNQLASSKLLLNNMPHLFVAILNFNFLRWLLDTITLESLKMRVLNFSQNQIEAAVEPFLQGFKNENSVTVIKEANLEKIADKFKFLKRFPLQMMRIKLPLDSQGKVFCFRQVRAQTLHFLCNPFSAQAGVPYQFVRFDANCALVNGHNIFTAIEWLLTLDSSIITFYVDSKTDQLYNPSSIATYFYDHARQSQPLQLKEFLKGLLPTQDRPIMFSEHLVEDRISKRGQENLAYERYDADRLAEKMAEDGWRLTRDAHSVAWKYVNQKVAEAVAKLTDKIAELNKRAKSNKESANIANEEQKRRY